ncbi:DUF2628 domain-containing protein [Methylocapsa palsarum]|uniref:DUF2628 domain-containing protein n=1 Tax=Methylocapsa palsarum TaxID=1612308 RepID=A0A1I3VVB3_9HYPH|nr:DUF2628 domain-containing protein [Methylocapsa palsarum]SFJ99090.1 Protein of unknown function [Methylocapsa palsarum]
MAVYSVHTREDGTGVADAAFVREGFSFGAFFFGPLWLARHRLWLAMIVWFALWLVLFAAAALNLWTATAALTAVLLLAALLGFEANALLEARLAKRGGRLIDVVAAPALEEAQSAFFRRLAGDDQEPAAFDPGPFS